MALRSVIDIDVDDSAFQRFAGMFRDYQEQVAKTAPAWEATSNAATKQTGALTQHVHMTTQIFQLQKRLGEQSEAQARNWFNMARDSKGFAQHITEATRQLLRWTSITTAISGLLGIGGLFGIDRLANAAFSQRRSALGLGVTPGEQAAFGLNFKRLVNPDQILSGVNESLHDLQKRQPLYGLGFNAQSLAGKDTAQVAVEALDRVKRLVDQTPTDRLEQIRKARQLDQLGFSLEDLQRIRATPAADIAGYNRQYQADSRGLNLDAQTTKAWDNLKIQLERAGLQIENTFIKGLVPLAGPLEHLSEVFSKAVADFMKSETARKGIDYLAQGIEHLGDGVKWLEAEFESKEFREGVKTFTDDVVALAKATGQALHLVVGFLPTGDLKNLKNQIGDLAKDEYNTDKSDADALIGAGKAIINPWIYGRPPDPYHPLPNDPPSANPPPAKPPFSIWDWLHPTAYKPYGSSDLVTRVSSELPIEYRHAGYQGNGGFADDICSCLRSATGGEGGMIHSAAFRPTMGGMSPVAKGENVNEAHDFFRAVGWSEAQTAGLLGNINEESGFNPKAVNETGHQGIAQWDSQRAARFRQMFGHDPARGSLEEQLLYMQWELRHSEAEAGDRLKRAMTPSQAAAAINESYERSGTPSGGRANAAEQYGSQFRDRSVTIKIQNATGGNANVSVSALSV